MQPSATSSRAPADESRRPGLAAAVRDSGPAVAVYAASRFVVMLVLALVGLVRHQSLGHYLARWDSHWYLSIARHGYVTSIPPGHGTAAQVNLGFFPLLPALVRAVHLLTTMSYPVAGEAVGVLSGASAAVALWWMVDDYYGRRVATTSVALVFFSPAAVVFSLVYSEGLIITLAAATLLALRRRRWILAGVVAALATACDPVASAVIAPCLVAASSAWRSDRDARAWWAPALAPLGVVSFFVFLWFHTGSPLSWYFAQRAGWQAGPLGTGVAYALYRVAVHGVADLNSLVKTITLAATVAVVVLWRRLRPPATWTAYTATVLFFGVLSPIVAISPRLALRGFPLFAFVAAGAPRRALVTTLVVGGVGMCLLCVASTTLAWTP